MSSELKTERHGITLVLTLSNTVSRNTLSEQMICAGIEALSVAEADRETRVVVLRGDGAHFCAGLNPAELSAMPPSESDAPVQLLDRLQQFIEVLRAFPKPVVAAVEGVAEGAGCAVALACDLIVAAEDARFMLSNPRASVPADAHAVRQLARTLPRQLVQQWAWLAEPVSARQWHNLGIVNWVADSGQALTDALAVATRLAAMAPDVASNAKELLLLATAQGVAPPR